MDALLMQPAGQGQMHAGDGCGEDRPSGEEGYRQQRREHSATDQKSSICKSREYLRPQSPGDSQQSMEASTLILSRVSQESECKTPLEMTEPSGKDGPADCSQRRGDKFGAAKSAPDRTWTTPWFWELLASVGAIFLLLVQVLILRTYVGTRTSTWSGPLPLNTVVAALSTVARAMTVFVAGEIIAEIQWTRMRTRAVLLHEVEASNQAGRGAWASLKFLVRSGRSPDLIVALLIVLVSLAMSTFSQQAIQIEECQFLNKSLDAIIPNIWTLGDLAEDIAIDNLMDIELEPAARAAVMLSLLDPLGSHSALQPTCPTGNCSFSQTRDSDGPEFTYRSLGFCAQCLDITPQISVEKIQRMPPYKPERLWTETRWRLPSGMEVKSDITSFPHGGDFSDITIDFLNITAREGSPYPITRRDNLVGSFDAATWNFTNVDILSINNVNVHGLSRDIADANLTATASTCSLYPCVKTYRASVSAGLLEEEFISSDRLTTYRSRFVKSKDNRTHFSHDVYVATDFIAVQTPCRLPIPGRLDGKVFTSENVSSAPGVVTLTRWQLGNATAGYIRPQMRGESVQDHPVPGKVHITAPPECIFALGIRNGDVGSELKSLLSKALSGGCQVTNDDFSDIGDIFEFKCKADGKNLKEQSGWEGMPAFWLEGIAQLPSRSHAELSVYWDNVAESLTRYLRRGAFRDTGRGRPGNEWRAKSEKALGLAWQTAACFTVNLYWLILPTALTAMTLLVLLWTMWRGKNEVVWKSSVLPLVYYHDQLEVVHRDERAVGFPAVEGRLMCDTELEKDAKMIRVMFRHSR